MVNRRAVVAVTLACALATPGLRAQDSAPVDTRFYVSPMFQYVFHPDDRREVEDGYGGFLNFGKRLTDVFEVELSGQYAQFDSNSVAFPATMRQWGVGGELNVYPVPQFLPHAYLLGNVDYGHTTGAPGIFTHYSDTLFDVGAGYNIPLDGTLGGLLPPGVALRLEVRYRFDWTHKGDSSAPAVYAGGRKTYSDGVLAMGFRFPLGAGEVPNPTPPPAPPTQVVPLQQPADTTPPPLPPPPPSVPPCTPPAPGERINLEGCKSGDVIILHGVNFDFNRASLTANARTILDGVADALNARRDIQVEIDGHTDAKGTRPYNLRLSQRRAASVKRYLAAHGVAPSRMTVRGFGKSRPLADNSTEEGRELNRRVELRILQDDGQAAATEQPAPPAPAGGSAAPEAGPR